MPSPELLPVVEVPEPRATDLRGAARYLDVNPKTVRRMVAAGAIHSVRIGREFRFTFAELDRVLREGARTR